MLVFAALAPFAGVAVHAAWVTWRGRAETEIAANLEVARTVAAALRARLDDVLHQDATLGRVLASGRFRAADATELLAAATRDTRAIRAFTWIAPDGIVSLSSDPALVGVSLADRDYYRRVTAGEDEVVSDLLGGQVDGLPVVVAAHAIRDANGRLLGLVAASLAPGSLAGDALLELRAAGGAVTIHDRAGAVVSRTPEPAPGADESGAVAAQPLVVEALAGRVATGRVELDGGPERLGAAVPVPRLGWAVRASRSASEAMGPLRRAFETSAAAALLAALLAIVGSAFLSERIVSALRALERHAGALGRGERPARPRASSAEIERLGRSYEQMAEKLVVAHSRFEEVLDATPAGVAVLDAKGLTGRWANAAFLAILDEPFRSGGITGRGLDEFLPRADALGLVETFRRVAADGVPHEDAELRLEGFARGTTWWRSSVRTIPDERGGTDLLLLVTEVTDQVLARERVEADRRRLEAVLRTLPVGVFIADTGGQLSSVNDEARRIWGGHAPLRTGATLREYRGRFAETGAPLQPGDWALQRALRGVASAGELVEIDRFDGTVGVILNSAAPIRDAGGRITGAVSTLLDVTELRSVTRHREEVLQVVSHDLRTPLATVVLGAAGVASLPDGPDALARARATARRIADAGRRMTRLIDDLLDVAGLEEGRLSMRRAPCPPVDLLGESADQIREAAQEKGLDVCLAAEPGLPDVDCDRDRILQVLGNVVSNAVKATAHGCVSLAAEARGDEVVFRVRDTGPGISDEELPHIFDRFRRAGQARYRGTGLGLAIARGIVEAHGGAIWAESAPGEGAVVSFTLPAAPHPSSGASVESALQAGAA